MGGEGLATVGGAPVRPADEREHPDAPVEAWWWFGAADDDSAGVFVGFELRGRRYDYWAGFVRPEMPYLLVEELDGTGRRQGLEIKPPEMWADHVCDVPLVQWSVSNEAHGVLLDDPAEAWNRAHGMPVPCTFDVEWYASASCERIAHGYRQEGEVDVRIELLEGVVAFTGPASRVHVWGAPYLPSSFAMPFPDDGLRAPYRRSDGLLVDQVLSNGRWWVRA